MIFTSMDSKRRRRRWKISMTTFLRSDIISCGACEEQEEEEAVMMTTSSPAVQLPFCNSSVDKIDDGQSNREENIVSAACSLVFTSLFHLPSNKTDQYWQDFLRIAISSPMWTFIITRSALPARASFQPTDRAFVFRVRMKIFSLDMRSGPFSLSKQSNRSESSFLTRKRRRKRKGKERTNERKHHIRGKGTHWKAVGWVTMYCPGVAMKYDDWLGSRVISGGLASVYCMGTPPP